MKENSIGNIAGASARYNTALMTKIHNSKKQDEQKNDKKDDVSSQNIEKTEDVKTEETETPVEVPNTDVSSPADAPNPHIPLPVDAPANNETTIQ